MHTSHNVAAEPRRVWRPSVSLAIGAAGIATTMSCIGIYGVMTVLMGMSPWVAGPLATLFEVALFALAALARERVLAGHAATRQLVLTWVFAVASGCVSAAHDLAALAPDGSWAWSAAPPALIAAGVRLAAPLIACELWHQVLLADAAMVEGRPSRTEIRIRRAMHQVAAAARTARLATQADQPAALAKLAAAYDRLLAMVPPHDPRMADFDSWLAAMARIDDLPGRTSIPGGRDRTHLAEDAPNSVATLGRHLGAVPVPTAHKQAKVTAEDLRAESGASEPAPQARTVREALEQILRDPHAQGLTSTQLAVILTASGHQVSARHLRRLRKALPLAPTLAAA